jgi:hypothetical protein
MVIKEYRLENYFMYFVTSLDKKASCQGKRSFSIRAFSSRWHIFPSFKSSTST